MTQALTALSRRRALLAGLGFGLTIDFLGRSAFAAAAGVGRRRLVVVICRGGMDGLSVSPPVGDPDYASLRGTIAIPPFGAPGGALKLDDTFGLHPALASVHALAQKGEARIAPAVATPDRERSHFEAQDVLENGATTAYGAETGWLNRALQAIGPTQVKAISVGPTAPLILRGPIEAASWSPGTGAERDPRLPGILQDLYADDPMLGKALASGLATEAMAKVATADAREALVQPDAMSGADGAMTAQADAGGAPLRPVLRQGLPIARRLGATLAGFMVQEGGPQVAAVSLDGFDTHANQGSSQGQLATRLAYLDAVLGGLAEGMGPVWKHTVVVAATEFGRTARVNGTAGTDHGTASTALLLGGALRRGGIVGDWPTLAPARLFENRDTFPTLDMRGLFKGLLAGHLGLDRRALDTAVFPGTAAVAPTAGVV
ncbi:MAG TPA: DUF1501 domain-containing protein [Caulobacteraceae bacterium]|nr:DUF1501 domain-containing protein [Caulobacteraceae bacterium]